MGTWIYGYVEALPEYLEGEEWQPIVYISCIVNKDYQAFGCLFGQRNDVGFIPIAPNRGLPADASYLSKRSGPFDGDFHSPSWITLAEIEAIDWDECAAVPCVKTYYEEMPGEFSTKCSELFVVQAGNTHKVGESWVESANKFADHKHRLHRVEYLTRREACQAFEDVFAIMRIIAKREWYSAEKVRMVVWFD